jgi:hypothetical protein
MSQSMHRNDQLLQPYEASGYTTICPCFLQKFSSDSPEVPAANCAGLTPK